MNLRFLLSSFLLFFASLSYSNELCEGFWLKIKKYPLAALNVNGPLPDGKTTVPPDTRVQQTPDVVNDRPRSDEMSSGPNNPPQPEVNPRQY